MFSLEQVQVLIKQTIQEALATGNELVNTEGVEAPGLDDGGTHIGEVEPQKEPANAS
jgi:hypothetical protein